MATPVRPNSYKLRDENLTGSSSDKRLAGDHKINTASIRHNPISRKPQTALMNAPRAKRVRQSRLHYTDPSGDVVRLPVPKLYFENEDFMELYADENDAPTSASSENPGSLSFLTGNLTSLLTGSPLPVPMNAQTASTQSASSLLVAESPNSPKSSNDKN